MTPFRSAFLVLLILTAACGSTRLAPTASPQPSPVPPSASPPPPTASPQPSPVPPSASAPPATVVCSPLATPPGGLKALITQAFIAPAAAHDLDHPNWVRKDDGHHGLDLGSFDPAGKLVTGLPVHAALAGRIASVVHDRPPYGNMLIIETPFSGIPAALVAGQKIPPGNSLYSLYGHLQNMHALLPGESVGCGEPLAETGMTGFTSGPHLHFETRWGPAGRSFDGMAYYKADASAQEMSNYEDWRMSADFHLFDPMALLESQ
jgi:murein DD-endopeptidase MepM/ murein hydrolase activator NlpD